MRLLPGERLFLRTHAGLVNEERDIAPGLDEIVGGHRITGEPARCACRAQGTRGDTRVLWDLRDTPFVAVADDNTIAADAVRDVDRREAAQSESPTHRLGVLARPEC